MKKNHIAALDGLRGFAALFVVFYHLFPYGALTSRVFLPVVALVRLGWAGVDLFFVLSGFLITGILLRTRDSPEYFSAFYARRILRIFPLYYALCFFFVVVIPRINGFAQFNYLFSKGASGNTWPYWLFLSNFTAQLNVKEHGVLCLCWSLAIEEQFYLLWPLVVRVTNIRSLRIACISLGLAAALARVAILLFTNFSPAEFYYLTPTRLDGLALGGLLSLELQQPLESRRLIKWFAAKMPFFMIAWLAFALYSSWKLPMQASLIEDPLKAGLGILLSSLLSGSLLAKLLHDSNSLSVRIFSVRWLTVFGKYSFAVYLLQFFVSWVVGGVLARTYVALGHSELNTLGGMSFVVFFLKIIVLLGFAKVSWICLEGPCNRLKQHFKYCTPTEKGPNAIMDSAMYGK